MPFPADAFKISLVQTMCYGNSAGENVRCLVTLPMIIFMICRDVSEDYTLRIMRCEPVPAGSRPRRAKGGGFT